MNNDAHTLNPWFTLWTEPRATIQQIVDSDPRRFVLVLAALGGFFEALDRASARSMGDTLEMPVIFGIALVFGPLGGLVTLYLGAALIGWTGRWIGGRASYEQIRAAIAWSSVPLLWLQLIWIPELLLFGSEMFTTEMPSTQATPSLAILLFFFGVVQLIGLVWFFVVYLKSLGQVQQFSAWKALGNVGLVFLILIVPLMVIFLGLGIISGASALANG